MNLMLTPSQREIIARPISGQDTAFVAGPVGAGKTTALQGRLRHLLSIPVRGESILVLVPDRGMRRVIEDMTRQAELGPHGRPTISTYYGLARQMVELFWPAIAGYAGFARPAEEPTFLTYETSQYLMHSIVEPLQERGFFSGLRVRPRRLMSQLLDNLNKAAIHAFPYTEIGERLSRAETQSERRIYYAQAQECANRFRGECLCRNVLDMSLTVEMFHQHLFGDDRFWSYFIRRYRHLIVDNLEETVPVAQDLIRRRLDDCDSATLAYDEGGGYRILLGVDPDGARELGVSCRHSLQLPDNFIANPAMRRFSAAMAEGLGQPASSNADGPGQAVVELHQSRYRNEMIAWVADRIAALVNQDNVPPAQIALVCPYADGILRFELSEALRARGVPFSLVRRWISFRDDLVARGLMTIASLAHPQWGHVPALYDVGEALHVTMPALDLVRAMTLASKCYRLEEGALVPAPDADGKALRERVGYAPMEAYGRLWEWIHAYQADQPQSLDHFLARMFEEVLCGTGFWSSGQPTARRSCARLIESARKFRLAAPAIGDEGPAESGRIYLEMVGKGIVAAQYVEEAPIDSQSVLLVTPAYAYLVENRRSDFQFWVDVGSRQWWRPPQQALTNPIVLSRRWDVGMVWDEVKDLYLRTWLLARMVAGLAVRCRRGIFACGSDVDSLGGAQDGPLFPALVSALAATRGTDGSTEAGGQ